MLSLLRLRGPLAVLLLLAVSGSLANSARAQVVVKLGTAAAVGSPWEVGLKDLARRWTAISGGTVTLKVYAASAMGDESDMIKKVRVGTLQAVAVSTIGLRDILPEPSTLSMPFLFGSNAEHDYVLDKVSPELEQAMEAKGYAALGWAPIGGVRLFSTVARPTLAEARRGKLFLWSGDPASKDAMTALGLKSVLLSTTDLIPSLTTGMVDEVFFPILPAFALGVHGKARTMSDLTISSLDGVIVIDKKTWDSIAADLRPKLLQATRDVAKAMTLSARKLEQDAVTRMKSAGLTVTPTPAGDWVQAIADAETAIRGKVFPAATFDRLRALVAEYRQKNP